MMESHALEEKEMEIQQAMLINRTGIMTNPELSAELIQGAKETIPSSEGDGEQIAANRAEYLSEALPIGSPPLPLPNGEDGAEEALAEQLGGLPVLLDKLGERLAFERQGTRLYEALVHKCESMEMQDDAGPTVEELKHICEEELQHFRLLQKAITALGGDATVMTPSADIAGVLSHGVVQIVSDPRTTIAQTLQAMLTAELADNDGWQMLQELAAEVGQTDLEEQCQKAFEEEQEHLEKVRGWLSAMTLDEAALMADEEALAEAGGEVGEKEEPGKKSKQTRKKSAKSSRSSKGKKKRK
jgi:rubrerythrin